MSNDGPPKMIDERDASRLELTAQRLLEAHKALGASHAQKTFTALINLYNLKGWEIRAVRARFQELLDA